MFVYLAVSASLFGDHHPNQIKIGVCWGDEDNKRKNVRYKEGFDIKRKKDIQAYDIRGAEWIESTIQELIKRDFSFIKHIPNDRFEMHSQSQLIDIYENFDALVKEAQEMYVKTFSNFLRKPLDI